MSSTTHQKKDIQALHHSCSPSHQFIAPIVALKVHKVASYKSPCTKCGKSKRNFSLIFTYSTTIHHPKMKSTVCALFICFAASIAVSHAVLGIDMSGSDCNGMTPATWSCLYNNGYRFAIIQVSFKSFIVEGQRVRSIFGLDSVRGGSKFFCCYFRHGKEAMDTLLRLVRR